MLKRFLCGLPIWAIVVGASAAPSFVLASGTSLEGRLVGIGVWVLIYALLGSTDYFARLWSHPTERLAIIITYSIRAFLGIGMVVIPPLAVIDILAGMASVHVAEVVSGQGVGLGRGSFGSTPFIPTAIATIVQGLLLSILTLGLLTIVRAIGMAATRRPTDMTGPRGFDVVMPAEVKNPNDSDAGRPA